MTNHRRNRQVAAVLAAVLAAFPAFAWGPRTQLSIVNTATHLVSREQSMPLTRLINDIRAGASISIVALEELYPDMTQDPLRAIENEMALLTAARGARIDAFYAWRLGTLGKLVTRVTAPLSTGDVVARAEYYSDADKAIDAMNLTPAPRRVLETIEQVERVVREANASNDLIESEYRSGAGFRGAASARLSVDASRSVNAVADVWWTVTTSRAVAGNISDAQLQRYVLSAFDYYIARGNMAEIDGAMENYTQLVAFTPDMRARLGDMLYAGGFQERAIREYEAALAAAPERRDVVERIGAYYFEQGEEALRENQLESALDWFRRTLSAHGLHPTAEQRRLEVETLIRRRDELQAQYQEQLKHAEELRTLAEEEASRGHYAEAVALLQQSEAGFNAVGDEFPIETQRRTRGLRDTQVRITELKQALVANTFAFSGAGFAPDLDAIIQDSVRGLEVEAITLLLHNEFDKMTRRLQSSMQPLTIIE